MSERGQVNHRARPDEIVIELPPKPEFVGTARITVAAIARHHSFGDEQVEDLKIAVSEAITNAVRAHTGAGNEAPIRLRVRPEEDRLVVEVLDLGGGFDAGRGAWGESTPPGELEGGFGLMLIRSLIIDTVVERNASGTLVRMTLKREEPSSGLTAV